MHAIGKRTKETAPQGSAQPRSRTWRSFLRSNSGASALEFAIVSVPFILLMLAIVEVGMVYFASFELENATSRGARLIRTGQAQNQKFDAAKFKEAVCQFISAPLDCGGLKIDVRHFSNFGDTSLPSPLDSKGGLTNNFAYDPGQGTDVVVVRTFYEWTLAAKLPKGIGLSNMANGDRLLAATEAFRNEPFKTEN